MPRYRDDDRYEEYDRPRSRPAAPPKADHTGLKIMAIISTALFAMLVVCGGCVYYVFYSIGQAAKSVKEDLDKHQEQWKEQIEKREKMREEKMVVMGQATRLANTFLSEAKAGRAADAYALTSAAYRQRVSQEQVADLLGEHADALKKAIPFRDKFLDRELDPPFTYSTKAAVNGRFVTIEATVVKEGDGWKVDRFIVIPD